MAKGGGKRKRGPSTKEDAAQEPPATGGHPKVARTEAKPADRGQWTNRQRTLVFSSRGISYRVRHLLNDLRALMPHSKKDAKMDRKDKIAEVIPEICELKNCNNCIYIEMRKKKDVYMWLSKVPHGPSAKFLVQNCQYYPMLRSDLNPRSHTLPPQCILEAVSCHRSMGHHAVGVKLAVSPHSPLPPRLMGGAQCTQWTSSNSRATILRAQGRYSASIRSLTAPLCTNC